MNNKAFMDKFNLYITPSETSNQLKMYYDHKFELQSITDKNNQIIKIY